MSAVEEPKPVVETPAAPVVESTPEVPAPVAETPAVVEPTAAETKAVEETPKIEEPAEAAAATSTEEPAAEEAKKAPKSRSRSRVFGFLKSKKDELKPESKKTEETAVTEPGELYWYSPSAT